VQTTGARTRNPGVRRPPRAGTALSALVAVLVSALLTGCTATGDRPAAPSASHASGTATPRAEAPSDPATAGIGAAHVDSVALTSGALTLTLALTRSADRAAVTAQPDGSVQASIPLPADLPADAARLTAPAGTTFEVQLDGSAVVRDAAGAFAGGLASPTATTEDGTLVRAQFEAAGSRVLRVVVSPTLIGGTPGASGAVTVWLGTALLESATWGEREGGRSLAVDPTPWARAGGLAAQDATWAAVVALAPEADTNGMHDQFLCHALGAADKATWNLEPWRPDVGSLATLAARCNPT
jgi:hypothetical protein